MKAAIIGYGKMGHAVEKFLLQRGHTVVCRIDCGNEADFSSPEFASADVAIEFSCPAAAVDNYRRAFAAGVPVVSGTTGWLEHKAQVERMVAEAGATLLWTSNFSIGVNLFMRVNEYLARLMEGFPQYKASLKEIHHIHKLDHPSGTAITLASGIIGANSRYSAWAEPEGADWKPADDVVPVEHEREGEVPGTHIISWTSEVDRLTIGHEAFSRDGFALGAVLAAEWVAANPDRHGMLTMNDFLDF